MPYPLITVEGTHYDMGVQHGSACADRIHSFFDFAIDLFCSLHSVDKKRVLEMSSEYLPVLESSCPHLVDEMRGVAKGAKLTLPEILFLHVRTELGYYKKSGCSAFAVAPDRSAGKSLLAGQNWDNIPYAVRLMIVLRLKPKNKPSILLLTFPGVVGYVGINSSGVSIWDNQLMCPDWKIGVPHYFMKRMVLERETLKDAVEILDKVEKSSSENFVMTDGTGRITTVECTPKDIIELPPSGGIVYHTNHFLADKFVPLERFVKDLPDTCDRLKRLEILFKEYSGRLSVETLKTIFSDHDNFPTSLCRHLDCTPQSMITCASIITEPEKGIMYVSQGNPCISDYERYNL